MKRLKLQIRFALLLIGFALTACERSEMTVPAFSGGSGAAPVAAPAQPLAPPMTAPMPMIDNLDAKTEDDSAEVWATDQADAARRCHEIAQSRTSTAAIVRVQGKPQQISQTKSSQGTYRFVCQLKIEHQ